MPNIVKCGLIQTSLACSTDENLETIRRASLEKHDGLIEKAARAGVQILCMQEIFTGPYFCAEQSTRWYDAVESIPDGPTVKLMQLQRCQVGQPHQGGGLCGDDVILLLLSQGHELDPFGCPVRFVFLIEAFSFDPVGEADHRKRPAFAVVEQRGRDLQVILDHFRLDNSVVRKEYLIQVG